MLGAFQKVTWEDSHCSHVKCVVLFCGPRSLIFRFHVALPESDVNPVVWAPCVPLLSSSCTKISWMSTLIGSLPNNLGAMASNLRAVASNLLVAMAHRSRIWCRYKRVLHRDTVTPRHRLKPRLHRDTDTPIEAAITPRHRYTETPIEAAITPRHRLKARLYRRPETPIHRDTN